MRIDANNKQAQVKES